MKQITINIPENKFSFFMKLMKSLNFVKVVEPAVEQLSPAQKATWDNVKQGFEELKMVEEGKIKTRPLQDLINEL